MNPQLAIPRPGAPVLHPSTPRGALPRPPALLGGNGVMEVAGSPLQSALLCQQGQRVPAAPLYPPPAAYDPVAERTAQSTLPPISTIKNNFKVFCSLLSLIVLI